MIGSIGRRFTRSIERDPWDLSQELEPEVDEASELPTDAAIILATTSVTPGSYPHDNDPVDYYKNIVRTALDNGGKYGDHRIPIPWLRMILAGLESRPMDPELMWYEVDADSLASISNEMLAYGDIFPSNNEPPAVVG